VYVGVEVLVAGDLVEHVNVVAVAALPLHALEGVGLGGLRHAGDGRVVPDSVARGTHLVVRVLRRGEHAAVEHGGAAVGGADVVDPAGLARCCSIQNVNQFPPSVAVTFACPWTVGIIVFASRSDRRLTVGLSKPVQDRVRYREGH
jgi:hypothetical protein